MLIRYYSDIHVEFQRDSGRSLIESLPQADVLILAGDIGSVKNGSTQKALKFAADKYPHVVFVCGNHDYWGQPIAKTEDDLRALTSQYTNLHWLNASSVTLEGQRFLGGTLWFPNADGLNQFYESSMPDFFRIPEFTPWVYDRHQRCCQFFATILPTDIVITHHLPTQKCVHPKWKNSSLNRFFVGSIPNDTPMPAHWVFGHTHENILFSEHGCTFRCNPYGYFAREINPGFDPNITITLP